MVPISPTPKRRLCRPSLFVFPKLVLMTRPRWSGGRSGRDEAFTSPPGQNPASGFPAPGSHLGQFGQRIVL
jgi:hypothetical protein